MMSEMLERIMGSIESLKLSEDGTQQTLTKTEALKIPRTLQTHLASIEREGFPRVEARTEAWRDAVFKLDRTDRRVTHLALVAEGYLRRSINNERSRGTWLVVSGPAGCGKTHVAKAVLNQFAAWGASACQRGKWGSLQWDFVDSPSMLANRNFEDRLDELQDVQFLVLDDIGSEPDQFRGGENAGRLLRLLEMFAKKWLVVTTNIPEAQWGTFYDARVASRLGGAGRVSMFGCADWRRKGNSHVEAAKDRSIA